MLARNTSQQYDTILWSNVYHVYLVYINYNPFPDHDYGYAIRCMANQ